MYDPLLLVVAVLHPLANGCQLGDVVICRTRHKRYSYLLLFCALDLYCSDDSEGSDNWAVSNGWVSVTPLLLRQDVPLRLVSAFHLWYCCCCCCCCCCCSC
jgi:hypothetical protein